MNRLLILLFLLLVTPAWGANAPDRRISDNDGDVLIINSDGSMPVTLDGGGTVTGFGGTTAINGNILVADGNAFNSVIMSGDATIDAAGVVAVSVPGVGASNLIDLSDVSSSTATAGRLLVSNGSKFSSESIWAMANGNRINSDNVGYTCIEGPDLENDLCIRPLTSGNGDTVELNSLRGTTILRTSIANFSIGDDSYLTFGNTSTPGDAKIGWETTGNDNLQIGTALGAASASGFISIMDFSDMGVANRSPSPTTSTPTLRIYSEDANKPLDYGDIYYDSANSRVIIDAGQGTVYFPDHIQSGAWTATAGRILVGDGSNFQSAKMGDQFTVATGANTACSTTCGTKGAVAGLDSATPGTLLAASDATADSCICVGGTN